MWIINELRIWRNNRRAIRKLLSGEWVLGEIMDFESWWNKQMVANWWETQTVWPSEYNTAKAAWQAAQQAEKERILKIVEQGCLKNGGQKTKIVCS